MDERYFEEEHEEDRRRYTPLELRGLEAGSTLAEIHGFGESPSDEDTDGE